MIAQEVALLSKYPDLNKCKIHIDCGQFENQCVTAEISFTPRYSDRYGVKSNLLFIAGEKSPHEYELSHRLHAEQLDPGPSGKDELIDRLWNLYNRKEVRSMKHYANHVFNTGPAELKEFVQLAGYSKKVFSAYAGCSMCKCSPGFRMPGSEQVKNVAIHLSITRK